MDIDTLAARATSWMLVLISAPSALKNDSVTVTDVQTFVQGGFHKRLQYIMLWQERRTSSDSSSEISGWAPQVALCETRKNVNV
ncbi:MAG: hypothetical protein K2I40_08070 [Bifidobacterium castoris]|nr:hypothetical protein [Bifidobacterium castoris]